MLRAVIIILLLLAITSDTFRMAWIQLDYRLHTSAYAANCENKSLPVMKCHGRCQMRKQIQRENSKDQRNPERKASQKNEIACEQLPDDETDFILIQTPAFSLYAGQRLPLNEGNASFHPPGIV